jgi:uroporphyrinogen-III decarboxylase
MANMGQVKGHPLDDWSKLADFRFPDPDNPLFYEGMEKHLEGANGKYRLTGIFMLLFERMHALRGLENTMMDFYIEREKIEMLADRIMNFHVRVMENISSRFPGQIHGLTFTDDWGTEKALLINPDLWREFFKPRYKRLFDTAKKAGWHVWMHSCGKVNAIIGDLIDIGLDVINLQQPRALGIEEVGREFRGRICFSSLCDIQHTLPFKDEKEIAEEAELLLRHWADERGGFILSDYGDGAAIGVGNDKKKIMLDAFVRADPWKNGVLSGV